MVLHYNPEENVMRDMNEYIIFNIFKFITPNDLYLFKKNKENMVVLGKSGARVTLLYLE
jgi:hypothetical protein